MVSPRTIAVTAVWAEFRSSVESVGAIYEQQTPKLYGLLEMPQIERPPLGAANTSSIRQRSCTA
jgi:hypothetical protein